MPQSAVTDQDSVAFSLPQGSTGLLLSNEDAVPMRFRFDAEVSWSTPATMGSLLPAATGAGVTLAPGQVMMLFRNRTQAPMAVHVIHDDGGNAHNVTWDALNIPYPH